MKKTYGTIFISVFLVTLFTKCGFKSQHYLQNTVKIKDSIIHKIDTVKIPVPGGTVHLTVRDTIFLKDTIIKKDNKSGLIAKVWRDKFNALSVECAKHDSVVSSPIQYKEIYKTVERTQEKPVKFIPIWVWLSFGGLFSLIVLLLFKQIFK